MSKHQKSQLPMRVNESAALQAASAHYKEGRLEEAKDLYRLILTQNDRNIDAMHRLGALAMQVKQFDKAAEFIGKAIDIGPATAIMHINHGASLRHLDKHEEALVAYNKAIALDPSNADAYFNMGFAFQASDKKEEAIAAYEQAIELRPTDAQAWVNLGSIYETNNQFVDALYAFETAAKIDPFISAAYRNMGSILIDLDLHEAALVLIEKALSIDPDDAEVRYHRCTLLLLLGYIERGWEDFDVRFEKFDEARKLRRPEPPPYWKWENVKDKRLLLWGEQGIGEELLAMGALPDFFAAGGDCAVECKESLVPTIKRSFPGMEVVVWNEHFDIVKETERPFDWQTPALNLIAKFGHNKTSAPNNGAYIKPDLDLQKRLRSKYERLAAGRRIVGISWLSTNDKLKTLKNIELTALHTIIQSSDIFVINLQYGDYDDDVTNYVQQYSDDVYDDPDVDPIKHVDQALAQVAAMDLVISISNSNVHMAGSMGIPAWLLLPKGPGGLWFWFLEGAESRWYPSVRIFRQRSMFSFDKPWWPGVIDDVEQALQIWLSEPLPSRIEP